MDGPRGQAPSDSPRIPAWASRRLGWGSEQVNKLRDLHFLSIQGMTAWASLLQLAYENEEGHSEELRLALLVDHEMSEGFSTTHGQAAVTLWSYLEGLIRAFVTDLLVNDPSAHSVKEIRGLKISYGVFQDSSPGDRARILFGHFEAAQAAGVRNGVQRFEVLLSPFALSGAVPDDVGKSLYELGQVRNVLLHRGGIVDQEFLDACPWVDATMGEPLKVSGASLAAYFSATYLYLTILLVRVGHSFGVDLVARADEKGVELPAIVRERLSQET